MIRQVLNRMLDVIMWKLLGMDDLYNPKSNLRIALDNIAKMDAKRLEAKEK